MPTQDTSDEETVADSTNITETVQDERIKSEGTLRSDNKLCYELDSYTTPPDARRRSRQIFDSTT
jgi:hypothetical protein